MRTTLAPSIRLHPATTRSTRPSTRAQASTTASMPKLMAPLLVHLLLGCRIFQDRGQIEATEALHIDGTRRQPPPGKAYNASKVDGSIAGLEAHPAALNKADANDKAIYLDGVSCLGKLIEGEDGFDWQEDGACVNWPSGWFTEDVCLAQPAQCPLVDPIHGSSSASHKLPYQKLYIQSTYRRQFGFL